MQRYNILFNPQNFFENFFSLNINNLQTIFQNTLKNEQNFGRFLLDFEEKRKNNVTKKG